MQIKFEPLANSDVKQPFYATQNSACMDFQICLTRPCYLVSKEDSSRSPFVAYSYAGRPLRSFISDEDVKAFEMPGSCAKYYRKNLPPQWEPAAIEILPQETLLVSLGVRSQFPEQHMLSIYIRSSWGLKGLQLANSVGIIDSDYRGELFAAIVNRNALPLVVTHQDRIVQGVVSQCSKVAIESGVVDMTDRGVGGFGSTGE